LFANIAKNITRIRPGGFVANASANPWTKIREDAIDEGREEYHLTFPIITRNRVYTSMFIETYDVIEAVEKGKNMLTITIFFRKWIPPLPLEIVKVEGGDYDGEVYYKESNEPYIKTVGFIDAVLDFGLSIAMQLYRYHLAKEQSAYTPEQMTALTFATGLDKSLGTTAFNLNTPQLLQNLMGIF
jgi:hypothetical protein